MLRDPQTAHAVHYVFEWAALALGLWWYRRTPSAPAGPGLLAPGNFAVVVGCLLGAAVGNKLTFWADAPNLWRERAAGLGFLLQGQSVVGALLGGWIGVEAGKRVAGIRTRTGDGFVQPILLGLAVGRIGCALAGIHDGTHGLPTNLPWGLDGGDGIRRHPVALIESASAFVAFAAWPQWSRPYLRTPGLAFRVFMLAYLLGRLALDTLKPVTFAYPSGLSGVQWICAIGATVVLLGLLRDKGRSRHVES